MTWEGAGQGRPRPRGSVTKKPRQGGRGSGKALGYATIKPIVAQFQQTKKKPQTGGSGLLQIPCPCCASKSTRTAISLMTESWGLVFGIAGRARFAALASAECFRQRDGFGGTSIARGRGLAHQVPGFFFVRSLEVRSAPLQRGFVSLQTFVGLAPQTIIQKKTARLAQKGRFLTRS